jgi:hypothetical protein
MIPVKKRKRDQYELTLPLIPTTSAEYRKRKRTVRGKKKLLQKQDLSWHQESAQRSTLINQAHLFAKHPLNLSPVPTQTSVEVLIFYSETTLEFPSLRSQLSAQEEAIDWENSRSVPERYALLALKDATKRETVLTAIKSAFPSCIVSKVSSLLHSELGLETRYTLLVHSQDFKIDSLPRNLATLIKSFHRSQSGTTFLSFWNYESLQYFQRMKKDIPTEESYENLDALYPYKIFARSEAKSPIEFTSALDAAKKKVDYIHFIKNPRTNDFTGRAFLYLTSYESLRDLCLGQPPSVRGRSIHLELPKAKKANHPGEAPLITTKPGVTQKDTLPFTTTSSCPMEQSTMQQ